MYWVWSFGGRRRVGGLLAGLPRSGERIAAIGGGVAPLGPSSDRLERVGDAGGGASSALGSGVRWAGCMPSAAGGACEAVVARLRILRADAFGVA